MMLDCEFIMLMIYIYEDVKFFIIVLGYKIKKKVIIIYVWILWGGVGGDKKYMIMKFLRLYKDNRFWLFYYFINKGLIGNEVFLFGD